MSNRIVLPMLPQPDDVTCGPTALHAVYRYYGEHIELPTLVSEVPQLDEGGTLAVHLGEDALRRGYDALLYTYDLRMFDPTWFRRDQPVDLADKLRRQAAIKSKSEKFAMATKSYLDYLEAGGKIRYEDLCPALIRRHLKKGQPILTGLSATYLYGSARELGDREDDLAGEPTGHFLVLRGYDSASRTVRIADPLGDNPRFEAIDYSVDMDHLIGAIFLGVVTYDANLLIVTPRKR